MAQYDELVEALIWLLTNRVQNKINYSHGLLGDGQGRVRVAGHEDFVYARPDRFNSRTQQVFNKRVEGQDGDPIIIGELPWEPGLTQVISIDWRTYKEIGWGGDTSGFVYHGRTHIWKDAAPGLDTFPVYRRQLGDLQATASVSGTNAVDISSYSIELYGTQKQFPGTIGFPLDNAIPTSTGSARMALLYWDPSSGTTGYIGVATGTAGIDSESTLLNRPVSLPGTLPIAFVRLNAGMAGITEFDIFDAREPFRPGIGFGTGSSQFHAGLIPIADDGGFYTGTSVESALQEIGGGGGAHTHDASDVSIADAGGYYTGTSVESALQEIGGGSLPGDTFKVSELWESDFGAVAWQTNAAGHLSATGKDLTTTGDISANDITASGNILLTSGATMVAGVGSSNPALGTEASGGRWGSIYLASATQINTLGNMDISAGAIGSEVVMIRLNNTAQDILYLGSMPSTGDDVDISANDGQVFIEGSSGNVDLEADIYPEGDGGGLFQRNVNHWRSPDDHFNAFSGWTWDSVTFNGAPSTVDIATYPSLLRLMNDSIAEDHFAYQSISVASGDGYNAYARLTKGLSSYVGIRLDNGDNNDFVECRIEDSVTYSGQFRIAIRWRVGGGSITTTYGADPLPPAFWLIQILKVSNAFYIYVVKDSPVAMYTGLTTGVGNVFALSRAGIIFGQRGAASAANRAGLFDWIEHLV